LVYLDTRGTAGEYAEPGANGRLAIAERIPGDPDARAEVVSVRADDPSPDTPVAWELQSRGSGRHDLRLHAGNKCQKTVVDVGDRHLQVIAQAKVHR
jgi:hypothetical protein